MIELGDYIKYRGKRIKVIAIEGNVRTGVLESFDWAEPSDCDEDWIGLREDITNKCIEYGISEIKDIIPLD